VSHDIHADRAAFEQLYRATRTDILAYLMRRLRNADVAADVLAETYLIAWQKFEAMPKGDEARPWLFGVARNLLLRDVRRSRVREAVVEQLASHLHTCGEGVAGPEKDPGEPVRAALSALPVLDQEIVTLTAWEGLSPREIAAVIGTSPNVVRIRLHRARTRLRRELAITELGPHAELVSSAG
jgi:RNA polymerase sigma factor (sigma-70 family)